MNFITKKSKSTMLGFPCLAQVFGLMAQNGA